ncbi:hypothetical protein BDW69DRAFT_188020 [Aspergillus filifer]
MKLRLRINNYFSDFDERMELNIPENHFLFRTAEDSYSPPITGSLYLPASSVTDAPEITIELVRYVRPKKKRAPLARSRWHLADSLSKRKSQSIQPVQPATSTPTAQTETLVRCQLWTSPNVMENEQPKQRYEFSFPVPCDIPATMQTVLGSVSYAVTATASSSTALLRESKTVNILRLVEPETISYIRRYPGDKVVTELRATPMALEGKQRRTAYHLEWFARSTITKGLRESEVRYMVARELRWRVDEIVSLTVLTHGNQRETICQETVRKLCSGKTKGRSKASGDLNEGSDIIRIPFEVRIPTAVESTDIARYQYRGAMDTVAITAEHRLYLEVITGEDTFLQGTRDLVDRKARTKSYKAAFVLPNQRITPDHSLARACLQLDNELPQYGAALPDLPTYIK